MALAGIGAEIGAGIDVYLSCSAHHVSQDTLPLCLANYFNRQCFVFS